MACKGSHKFRNIKTLRVFFLRNLHTLNFDVLSDVDSDEASFSAERLDERGVGDNVDFYPSVGFPSCGGGV